MDAEASLSAMASRSEVAPSTGKARWAAAGGILGALAASSCCILPLALFMLGVSGAWIGNLTALAPYQPILFAATVGCLGVGYYLVYRQPKTLRAAIAEARREGGTVGGDRAGAGGRRVRLPRPGAARGVRWTNDERILQ